MPSVWDSLISAAQYLTGNVETASYIRQMTDQEFVSLNKHLAPESSHNTAMRPEPSYNIDSELQHQDQVADNFSVQPSLVQFQRVSNDEGLVPICSDNRYSNNRNQIENLIVQQSDLTRMSSLASSDAENTNPRNMTSPAGAESSPSPSSSPMPVSVQIFMGETILTQPQLLPPTRALLNNPRYMCCKLHATKLATVVAYLEILFSLLFLITVVVFSVNTFEVTPTGMILGVLANSLIVTISALLLLVGLRQRSAHWLLPYFVVKGLQISALAIGLVVSFLGLVAFTALFGIVAATSGDSEYLLPGVPSFIDPDVPQYDTDWGSYELMTSTPFSYNSLSMLTHSPSETVTPDPGQTAVNRVTIILSSLLIILTLVLAFMIFFVIILFKTYRYLKELHYYINIDQPIYQTNTGVGATNMTPGYAQIGSAGHAVLMDGGKSIGQLQT